MQASIGAIAVLAVALAAVTGCSNVSLKEYYARVPPTTPIDIDPIGGYEDSAQHPTLCRTKALPASGVLAENVLFSYCVKRLPQGTRYHAY